MVYLALFSQLDKHLCGLYLPWPNNNATKRLSLCHMRYIPSQFLNHHSMERLISAMKGLVCLRV